MKKNLCFIFLVSAMLFSCSDNKKESMNLSDASSQSQESSSSTSSNSSLNIDYEKFDKNIIGTWYIHSSMMGELEINTSIVIKDDYTLQVKGFNFNYIGEYEAFEDTHLFLSTSKITQFIVSYDSDNELIDWGFFDTANHSDMGIAQKEQLSSSFNYSYAGPTWPIEQINSYLSTEGSIPSIADQTFYLLCSISQVHGEAKYAMIDIFGLKSNAEQEYLEILKNNGFVVQNDRDNLGFYRAFDNSQTYAILVKFFSNDNLTIFVYNYTSIFNS